MSTSSDCPELTQTLANSYVELAISRLSDWGKWNLMKRSKVFEDFTKKALLLLGLSEHRDLEINELDGPMGTYIPGVITQSYLHENPIALDIKLFEASYPTGAVEVFAHECVHAIQEELCEETHTVMCLSPAEAFKYHQSKEDEAYNFQECVGIAMRRHELFADSRPICVALERLMAKPLPNSGKS